LDLLLLFHRIYPSFFLLLPLPAAAAGSTTKNIMPSAANLATVFTSLREQAHQLDRIDA
jgi:hypothetical protein